MHTLLDPIDRLLNSITMYRLVLYGLTGLSVYTLVLSLCGLLSFSFLSLLASLGTLLSVCVVSNWGFSKLFRAPVNIESQCITAYILFLILFPATTLEEYVVLIAASVLSMGSKYVVAIKRKHIINPAVCALVVLGIWGRGEAIWWVGSVIMVIPAAVLSFLIIRKVRRYALALTFLATSFIATLFFGIQSELALSEILQAYALSGPLFFFVGVMLTEPLTTPPSLKQQIVYGGIVGALYGSQFSFGPFLSSPELALFLGNIFSYAVSPKYRLKLYLKEKREVAANIFEFVFKTSQKVQFSAGQYFEWTLPHTKSDSRGVRRFFTIASSPQDLDIRLGVRVEKEGGSSFKQALSAMKEGDPIMASSLGGEFVLGNPKEKVVFIGGGIGVTPFRSMIAELVEKNEKRDIVFFYANRNEKEIAYSEIFEKAKALGIKTVYLVNKATSPNWKGYSGFLTQDIIEKEVPDYRDRTFYISGSHGMVTTFEKLLKESKIPSSRIHTDFFPGFA